MKRTPHKHRLRELPAELVVTTDPRMSDARTPLAHTHGGGDITSQVADAAHADEADAAIYALTAGSAVPSGHHTTHEPGGPDAMAADAAPGTASLRSIGTSSVTACAGDDSRLSNARAPTAHAVNHDAGGTDAMAIDAVAATGSLRTLGTGAAQACAGNDSRLSDARTPAAHASSHKHLGADEVATGTAGANLIPKADASAVLALPWMSPLISARAVSRRRWTLSCNRGASTKTGVGAGVGTPSGTIGTTADSADGPFQTLTTAAPSGSAAGGTFMGTGATGSDVQTRWKPIHWWRFRTGTDITFSRYLIGLTSAAIGTSDTPSVTSTILLRYSTGAADAGWVVYTSNGAAGTTSAMVAAIAADTAYLLVIDCRDSASIKFWIGTDESNLSLVHAATGTLPASSTALFSGWASLTNLTGSTRFFSWGHMGGSHI